MFRRRNSSDTAAMNSVGQKVKNIIPEGFAERLIADDFDPRQTRWRSRSVQGLSSSGGGRMEVSFPSRSC